VTVAGLDDEWLAEQDARLKSASAEADTDAGAMARAKLIQAYYNQQRRRRGAYRADGAIDWMAE
jgi:hypothetical protein